MTSRLAQEVTNVCNELPFVNWDRFVDCGSTVVVFGWIDREEETYKDFVCVEITRRGHVDFTTSSARYSETISSIYAGCGRLPSAAHEPCQRIEDNDKLTGIERAIRIRNGQSTKLRTDNQRTTNTSDATLTI